MRRAATATALAALLFVAPGGAAGRDGAAQPSPAEFRAMRDDMRNAVLDGRAQRFPERGGVGRGSWTVVALEPRDRITRLPCGTGCRDFCQLVQADYRADGGVSTFEANFCSPDAGASWEEERPRLVRATPPPKAAPPEETVLAGAAPPQPSPRPEEPFEPTPTKPTSSVPAPSELTPTKPTIVDSVVGAVAAAAKAYAADAKDVAAVREEQERLQALAYYTGAIDGRAGPRLRRARAEFARDERLDDASLPALRQALKNAADRNARARGRTCPNPTGAAVIACLDVG